MSVTRGPYALRIVRFVTVARADPPAHLAIGYSRVDDPDRLGLHDLKRETLCGRRTDCSETMEEYTFAAPPPGPRCQRCDKALGNVLGAWFGRPPA